MNDRQTSAEKLTDVELDALFKNVADGIVKLAEQSEANGDKNNRARVLFYALSAYMAENELLDNMSACAAWMEEQLSSGAKGPFPSRAELGH